MPGHHRWGLPGKKETDFDKLRFEINFQLSLCSSIEMLGAPKNNLFEYKALGFIDILISIMSFDLPLRCVE